MYKMIGLKHVTNPLLNNIGCFLYASKITCTTSVLVSFMSMITLTSLSRHCSNTSCNNGILSPSENLFLWQNNDFSYTLI